MLTIYKQMQERNIIKSVAQFPSITIPFFAKM